MADSRATPANPGVPVSVLILTLNEEANIQRCIEALDWCDDIVVLDSLSTDTTREIAQHLGARVFERAFDNFAAQRNHALEHIRFQYPWVLHLDADEVVTPELRNEMAARIAEGQYGAFRVPSKLMFQGRWMKHSGMYPCYQVRLGRLDALRFEQVGHGQRELLAAGEIGTLSEPYLHYGFSKGLTDWIERHNRYSSAEAEQNVMCAGNVWAELGNITSSDRTDRRRAVKAIASRMPFRPFLRFVYMYLLKLGFLDGKPGWDYCRMMASYEYWTVAKERELRRGRD